MQATTMTRPRRRHPAGWRRPTGEATLVAAATILGRGDRLTVRAMAEELGLSRKSVEGRVATLRKEGRFPHEIARRAPAVVVPRLPKVRTLSDRDMAFLAAAASVADEDMRVNFSQLATAYGKGMVEAQVLITSLRKRQVWPYFSKAVRDVGAADPAIIVEILAENRKLMGDGRREIDDPREHGRLTTPSGGRDHNPAPRTAAQACRAMLREWRGVVRRARTQQEPAR